MDRVVTSGEHPFIFVLFGVFRFLLVIDKDKVAADFLEVFLEI